MTALATRSRLLGPAPTEPLPVVSRAELLDLVEAASLTGRGGGGFPTVRKLSAVGRAPVVVGNAMEGEPLSRKDAALLHTSPDLVLDGLVSVGRALDARRLVLAVGPDVARTAARLHRPGVEVARLAGGFVAGQETALVHQLDGGPPVPRDPLVRVTTRGVGGRATLVLNAETLAEIALLVRYGVPDRATSLFTISGAVGHPGVVEARRDAPLEEILASSAPAPGPVLVGGYHGAWVTDRFAPVARPGAGVLHVLGDACPLAWTAEATAYLAGQSARQCGPCVNGLPRISDSLARLARLSPDPALPAEIARLSTLVTGRGACAHPDGTARLVASTLAVFADHVSEHLAGRCGS